MTKYTDFMCILTIQKSLNITFSYRDHTFTAQQSLFLASLIEGGSTTTTHMIAQVDHMTRSCHRRRVEPSV